MGKLKVGDLRQNREISSNKPPGCLIFAAPLTKGQGKFGKLPAGHLVLSRFKCGNPLPALKNQVQHPKPTLSRAALV